ncbi:GyrI-like domain-containing protein [Marinomonas posidonica]|uniref:AraC family transcriptional regulator n=1 Tax=Marinomonas posidonica TaxID=936476 RepID=UPI003736AAA9
MGAKQYYKKRMQVVCDYIYAHLDDDLRVEDLSQIAHFSKYHFHRQFSLYMGQNVFKFIQQLRLKRAAYELVFQPEKRITDIAIDAKFEFPESFSRAFKKAFSQSPSEFRRQPDLQKLGLNFHKFDNQLESHMKVDVVHFETTKIALLKHRASPDRIMESVSTFREWRKATGLLPITKSRRFNIIYEDPTEVMPEDFRCDIATEVKSEVADNDYGVINGTLAGGRYAVVRHLGPYHNISRCLYFLYGEWLPDSGEELRDAPCFLQHHNHFPEVAEHELITDVYLPIV